MIFKTVCNDNLFDNFTIIRYNLDLLKLTYDIGGFEYGWLMSYFPITDDKYNRYLQLDEQNKILFLDEHLIKCCNLINTKIEINNELDLFVNSYTHNDYLINKTNLYNKLEDCISFKHIRLFKLITLL